MKFRCPVCLYAELPYSPSDYHICPCCGTEFGNDDAILTHDDLRHEWINGGVTWFFGNPPVGWNPWVQLEEAGYAYEIPWLRGLTVRQTVESIYNVDSRFIIAIASPFIYQTA